MACVYAAGVAGFWGVTAFMATIPGWDPSFAILCGLLALLVPAVYVLRVLRVRQVRIGVREAQFTWGWPGLTHDVAVPLERLRLVLREHGHRADECVTALVAGAAGSEGTVLLVATSSPDRVWDVYQALARRDGLHAREDVSVEVRLADGGALCIPRLPTSRVQPRYVGTRLPCGEASVGGRPRSDVFLVGGMLLLFGVGFIFLAATCAFSHRSVYFRGFVGFLLPLFPLDAAMLWAITRRPVADGRSRSVCWPRGIFGWRGHDWGAVAAVQLCAYPMARGPAGTAFELNVVLRDPPGERRPFFYARSAPEEAREQAGRLAQFLGVPLLDHMAGETAASA